MAGQHAEQGYCEYTLRSYLLQNDLDFDGWDLASVVVLLSLGKSSTYETRLNSIIEVMRWRSPKNHGLHPKQVEHILSHLQDGEDVTADYLYRATMDVGESPPLESHTEHPYLNYFIARHYLSLRAARMGMDPSKVNEILGFHPVQDHPATEKIPGRRAAVKNPDFDEIPYLVWASHEPEPALLTTAPIIKLTIRSDPTVSWKLDCDPAGSFDGPFYQEEKYKSGIVIQHFRFGRANDAEFMKSPVAKGWVKAYEISKKRYEKSKKADEEGKEKRSR